MRPRSVMIAFFVVVSFVGGGVDAAEAKPQVMILGVAHLVSHHDIHNSQFSGDPLSPDRQAQIAEIVARLGRFHPTKVLIEAPADDPRYAQRFTDYAAGRYVLPPSEDYQFGFRLAKEAHNPTIYAVDTWGPPIIDDSSAQGKRVDAYLKATLPHVSTAEGDAFRAKSTALEKSASYLDLLRYLNTDEAIRANASWYSVVDGVGRAENFAGASYVAQWYTRNCYIFANILNVLQPDDRAVVVFGQGHEYLLRDFARLNPDITYVDPLRYLL
jgi:uncharacterized protein DUF5694